MNIRKKPEKQYGNRLMGSFVGVPSSSSTWYLLVLTYELNGG